MKRGKARSAAREVQKLSINKIRNLITSKKIYKHRLYVAWRKKVFLRDKFTCQICDARGGGLEAHHILRKSEYPEKIFDVANGLTLCYNCHHTIHRENIDKELIPKFQKIVESKKKRRGRPPIPSILKKGS